MPQHSVIYSKVHLRTRISVFLIPLLNEHLHSHTFSWQVAACFISPGSHADPSLRSWMNTFPADTSVSRCAQVALCSPVDDSCLSTCLKTPLAFIAVSIKSQIQAWRNSVQANPNLKEAFAAKRAVMQRSVCFGWRVDRKTVGTVSKLPVHCSNNKENIDVAFLFPILLFYCYLCELLYWISESHCVFLMFA